MKTKEEIAEHAEQLAEILYFNGILESYETRAYKLGYIKAIEHTDQQTKELREEIERLKLDRSNIIVEKNQTICDLMEEIERLKESKWICVDMPKDGTSIIRWHKPSKNFVAVLFNNQFSRKLPWICTTKSHCWPEESFEPNIWQPLPNNPL